MGELSKDGFPALTPEALLGPLNEVEAKHAPKVLYFEGHRDLITAGPREAIADALEFRPGLPRESVGQSLLILEQLRQHLEKEQT